jgi:hypothetical protein
MFARHVSMNPKPNTRADDPRMTWQYFAVAVAQEPDRKRLTYLLQQLHGALDKADPEGDEVRAFTSSRLLAVEKS